MNDTELKQLLALLLPETVEWEAYCGPEPELHWTREARDGQSEIAVLDTELLHLCSLVEAGLTVVESCSYFDLLRNTEPDNEAAGAFAYHATWQQRVTALASVKGATL